MSELKPIKIIAMGKYLPKAVLSSELEENFGLPQGWAKRYSGVEKRHQVTTEYNAVMGARAAEEALKNANMSLGEVDLIISASGSYDYPIPNQASIIKAEMKGGSKYDMAAIDIDSTCLSFVAAFDMASKMLDGKMYKNILIVSSEISSKNLDPNNWETLTLFGDAAVAAIVSYDSNSDSRYIKGGQRTYSDGVYHTVIEGGGIRNSYEDNPFNKEFYSFKMNGKHLLRLARKKVPQFMDWFFKDIPYDFQSIDAIIPHQASKTGMLIFKNLYTLKEGQVKETLHKYGNCIAASIPLTLMDCIESGEIKRGDICLLSGTSAGFSIGGVLIKY